MSTIKPIEKAYGRKIKPQVRLAAKIQKSEKNMTKAAAGS